VDAKNVCNRSPFQYRYHSLIVFVMLIRPTKFDDDVPMARKTTFYLFSTDIQPLWGSF